MPETPGLRARHIFGREVLEDDRAAVAALSQDVERETVARDNHIGSPPVIQVLREPRVTEYHVGCLGEHVIAEVAGLRLERSIPPVRVDGPADRPGTDPARTGSCLVRIVVRAATGT